MALPLGVEIEVIRFPPLRPVTVVGRITSPLALYSDHYIGGEARGERFTYRDGAHFVWWSSEPMPVERQFSDAFSAAFR